MLYLGIDVSKDKHVACIIDDKGEIVKKPFSFSVSQTGFNRFFDVINNHVNEHNGLAIGLEATGHYWLTLYNKLCQSGYSPIVMNPLEVSAFRNKGIRGSKTDTIDALLIANVLRYGTKAKARIPNEKLLALKRLTRYRADRSHQLCRIQNKVNALLDQIFPEYKKVFNNIATSSSIALLSVAPSPEELLAIPIEKLSKLIHEKSQGRYGSQKAQELRAAAQNSCGLNKAVDILSFQTKCLIDNFNYIKEQIKLLDRKIKETFESLQTRLTSIPGISYTNGATILAEIGDVNTFHHRKGGATALVAFAGIDPKLRESGVYKGHAKMSKRGSRYLRQALYMASFVAIRCDPAFRKIYTKQISRGKHCFVALSHVERKMIHVIYSVLKNNKEYVPMVN